MLRYLQRRRRIRFDVRTPRTASSGLNFESDRHEEIENNNVESRVVKKEPYSMITQHSIEYAKVVDPKCLICCDLDSHMLPLAIHLDDLMGLKNSKCLACTVLHTMLLPYHAGLLQQNLRAYYVLWIWKGTGGLRMDVEGNSRVWLHFEIHAEGGPSPWAAIPVRSRTNGVNNPLIALQQVKQWLQKCSEEHSCVSNDLKNPCLPTRIIEISGKRRVRLLLTKAGQMARYACLSHVWGGEVPLRTTKTTFESFQARIAWSLLPPTFQQAIDMTYRLGIDYLWIDSLCILQDDEEDWQNEGSRMASIYSGAYITLAATYAKNSRGGLYHTPGPSEYSYPNTGWSAPNIGAIGREHTFCNDQGTSFTLVADPTFREFAFGSNKLPLQQRAWCWQERSLSPRVVHFADTMLYWECLEEKSNEYGEEVYELRECPIGVFGYPMSSIRIRSPTETPYNEISQSEAFKWRKLICKYTDLQLTMEKDILPALQGMATRSASKRASPKYLAGLWEDSIYLDLTWSRSTRDIRLPVNQYRAPSWSWAATAGPVTWLTEPWNKRNNPAKYSPEATIISVHTDPISKNPFGEVSGGILTIRGICLPATIKVIETPRGTKSVLTVRTQRMDEIDDLLECRGDLLDGQDNLHGYSIDRSDLKSWSPDSQAIPSPAEDLLIMLIGTELSTGVCHLLCFKRAAVEGIFHERIGYVCYKKLAARARFLREGIEQVISVV